MFGFVTADSTLKHLKKVQIALLHCLLHVHKRSMASILFSETGFTLIRYRRLILTLRYLLRLLAERHTSSRLAPLGIDACEALWQRGRRMWLGDIADILQRLYRPIVVSLDDLCSTEQVNDLVSSIIRGCHVERRDRRSHHWLSYFGSWAATRIHMLVPSFRSYLNICISSHGIALTRALTGTHYLAIRGAVGGKWVGLARQWQLCRMCHDDVEDVVRVLFMCSRQTYCKRRDILTKETFPEAVPSRTDSNGTQETGILAESTND